MVFVIGASKRRPPMDSWTKGVLSDFRSVDRVLLYMMKVMELIDLQKLMTEEDISLIKRLVKENEDE